MGKRDHGQGLSEALAELGAFTAKGDALAEESIRLLEQTVSKASSELQESIDALQADGGRERSAAKSLSSQLESIRRDYGKLPRRLRDEVEGLPDGAFSITLFGRTTVGKSTLMNVLTHGDGSQIGNGSQRTTRDVRAYDWRGLRVTDVPGIAAFEGKEDEAAAFESARRSDLVLFLINGDPQQSEAEFLSRVKDLGKPVACIVNMKRGIRSDGPPDEEELEDLCGDLCDMFAETDELERLRRSLVDFGPAYGQDWERIPFAFAHLKSAFLSQRPGYEGWSERLYEMSHFDDVLALIEREAREKAGLYRLKSRIDAVSAPLVGAFEELLAQGVENAGQAGLLAQKRDGLDAWTDGFEERAASRVEELLDSVADDLRCEASDFAEDHFDDKDAGLAWSRTVKRFGVQKRANALLRELEAECEEELAEIGREIEFDVKLAKYRLSAGGVKGKKVVDTKRAWKLGTAVAGGGLTIAAVVAATPLVAASGTVVGVLGAAGSLFAGASALGTRLFTDAEKKRKDARADLERQLNESIDASIERYRELLERTVSERIVEEQLRATCRELGAAADSLSALGATQRRLARRVNKQLRALNGALVSEADAYRRRAHAAPPIAAAARVPGGAVALVVPQDARTPRGLKQRLAQLLGEDVRLVVASDDAREAISRTVGRGCGRDDVRIERRNGKPVAARVAVARPSAETRLGVRLAMQVAGLLVTEQEGGSPWRS